MKNCFDANKNSSSNSSTKTKRRRGQIIESEDVPVNVGRIENTRKMCMSEKKTIHLLGHLPNDINLYTIQDYVSRHRMISFGYFLRMLVVGYLLVCYFWNSNVLRGNVYTWY